MQGGIGEQARRALPVSDERAQRDDRGGALGEVAARVMETRLLEITDYPAAVRTFDWKALWGLVDGTAERLNLAHECVDRHPPSAPALRIQRADGGREIYTFGELAAWSSRFAHWLEAEGVGRGERVAIMLEPSLPFYGALFGGARSPSPSSRCSAPRASPCASGTARRPCSSPTATPSAGARNSPRSAWSRSATPWKPRSPASRPPM